MIKLLLITSLLCSSLLAQGITYSPLWRVSGDSLYTVRNSIYVHFNNGVEIDGILYCDSIVGGSPIYIANAAIDTLDVEGEWYRTGFQTIDDDSNTDDDVSVVFIDTDKATLRLPDASICAGRIITIKAIQTHVNIEVGTQGGSIEGANTFDMGKDYDTITVISDGSDWWTIASGYKL